MAFPIIRTIDDVLPHIMGNDNFCVNHKDDYIVIDYILSTPETFHNPVEKECRGIIFYADGRIMVRRLHKFFNVNERPETLVENLDFSKPHWILEKLDGSIITPMAVNGMLTWGSKAGVTFLTPQIEEFVKTHPGYAKFAVLMINDAFTPIFEWCSRQNRIVIDYPEDRLVLLAIRNNITGVYLPYEYLVDVGEEFKIEVVKEYPGNVKSMQELVDATKPLEGLEGFVVRWDDGSMVKVKADQYVLFHKSKDDLMHEKNVVAILTNGTADDFRVLLSELDRAKFEAFEKQFWENLNRTIGFFQAEIGLVQWRKVDRKDYAIRYADAFNHSRHLRALVFRFFGENPSKEQVREELINIIKKNTGSQANVDKIRELFGGNLLKWNY
jgi:RNA ligase